MREYINLTAMGTLGLEYDFLNLYFLFQKALKKSLFYFC